MLRPADLSAATIWSPLSISAATTMYTAPPTTATTATTATATQVIPADSDRGTPAAAIRRCNGRSSAVPSNASSMGVTAVRKLRAQPDPDVPDTRREQDHPALGGEPARGIGSRCTAPADHDPVACPDRTAARVNGT
jgi:hypothetical protein